ncbi:MAG: hypothetical protein ABJH04_08120 [Cyclobacteriaceae bacterium]
MRIFKTTHIDTGGHGYLSVSKVDFLKVLKPDQISGASGHNLNRIYLEEDLDATVFLEEANKKGYVVDVKHSYNLHFNCTHNYDPKFFHFKPVVGDKVLLHDDMWYAIVEVNKSDFRVRNSFTGQRYKLTNAKCMECMKDAKGEGILLDKIKRIAQSLTT